MSNCLKTCLFLLVAAGCAHPPPTLENNARTFVEIAPRGQPGMTGAYDFDLLGNVNGTACAAFTGSVQPNGLRLVTVNGVIANYRVAISGRTEDDNASEIQRQSEAAAVFDALGKLHAADVMLVTRSRTIAKSQDEVCTMVWGQAVRLKKAGKAPEAQSSDYMNESEPADSAAKQAPTQP